MKQGLVRLQYHFGKRFMGWTLHMIMCVLLCYPVSIRTYYEQGVLFLVLVNFTSCFGADFTKGLSLVWGSNLRLLSQIIGIFFLSPWAQPLWISQKVLVSALPEPLAQMLRLVESGLKFCKQRLKYGRHNSFSTLKFEMSENKVEIHKTKYWSSVWVVLHVYKVSHWKTAFDQSYYVSNKKHICHQ